jgi:hypothetical protein
MKNRRSLFLYVGYLVVKCQVGFGLFLLLSGCEDSHLFDFTKSNGEIITISRNIDGNFTKVILNDDINLVLMQDGQYSIRLEGGENLLSGIETTITDSTLTISNKNTFNWVRSYDKEITAYVSMPHVFEIKYNATGNLTNEDTIREDSLTISAVGGSGYIDMVIRTGTSKINIMSGSADLKVSGVTGVNYIYSGGFGPIYCQNLRATYLFMRNISTNNCYVWVTHEFGYEIMNLGNIYYRGEPSVIQGSVTGSGKLIHLP